MSEIIYEPYRTRPLADFYEELRFEFPDLPDQLFQYYLLKAVRRLASDGKVIRRVGIIHARQGVTRYRLESPDGLEIVGILRIRSIRECSCGNGCVTRAYVEPCEATCCGRDVAWYDDLENELHIKPPFCSGTYYLDLAVSPSMDACELPEVLLDHIDTLLLGVKAGILGITTRPWTNLALADIYRRRFEDAIRSDAVEVATHKMRGAVRMNFRRVL